MLQELSTSSAKLVLLFTGHYLWLTARRIFINFQLNSPSLHHTLLTFPPRQTTIVATKKAQNVMPLIYRILTIIFIHNLLIALFKI
jgi:hypothetical protein